MKKNVILLFFLFVTIQGFGQEDAWIYFSDKPNSSTYLANPLTMLTQRSIDRRTIQNIPIDISDVPIHQAYIDQIANVSGIQVKAKSKWFNCIHVRGTQSVIQSLSAFSFVSTIKFANNSLNTRNSGLPNYKNNSPVNKNLNISENYDYGSSANQIQMLNGHFLHQQNYTGQGKIIAVLDSGFIGVDTASPFQNLVTNNKILGGYNFPDQNSNYFSRHNHGTMVLSCMGGFVDGQLVGTAPNSSYYLFITEDINSENPVEESYWVEAAELADYYGVDVINTSLGYFTYDNPNYSYTYNNMNGITSFISKGADKAFSKGMIVVASAGNSGATSNPHIGCPADAINVLTVGAVNSLEAYASFSSIGPSFDGRVKPDVCAKGVSATVSNISGTITTANGTSFSSPVMAGMVATFWSAFPTLTNAQVIQFVKQSADLFTNPTAQKGYGVPDFQLAFANASDFDLILNSPLQIYPNPVSDNLFLSKGINGSISIFDIVGKEVINLNLNPTQQVVDLSNFHSGIYFYYIQSIEGILKGKIIKN